MMKNNKTAVFTVMALLLALSVGCASLLQWNKDNSTLLRATTKAVTAEFLVHNPTMVPVVVKASRSALAVLSSDAASTASVPELQAAVMKAIQPAIADLTPESKAAIMVLVGEIQQAVEDQLAKQTTPIVPEEVRVQIQVFVGWVNEIAEVYALSQPAVTK